MDKLGIVIQKYKLTKEDLLQNAELLEKEGSYLNMCLFGYSAKDLKDAARDLELAKGFVFDIQKAYDAGINCLYFGGEIIKDEIFREKDIFEGDYSTPLLQGRPEIINMDKFTVDTGEKFYFLEFENGASLLLSEEEMLAGMEKNMEPQKEAEEEIER